MLLILIGFNLLISFYVYLYLYVFSSFFFFTINVLKLFVFTLCVCVVFFFFFHDLFLLGPFGYLDPVGTVDQNDTNKIQTKNKN